MKRLLLIALLSLFGWTVKSQNNFKIYKEKEIREENIKIQIGQIIKSGLEIRTNRKGKLFYEIPGTDEGSMKETMPVNMIIRILDASGTQIKDIETNYNDRDIDLSQLGLHYIGERKFQIIHMGRYSLNILNLNNYKLIGPLYPEVEGDRGDSQDGSISTVKVFNNGQYLIGYSWGMGLFCYSLMDLYNPVQVESFHIENSHISGNFFFLDKRKENIYNGIFVEMPRINKIDTVYFLFQGLELNTDGAGKIEKLILDNKFLVLQKNEDSGEKAPFVIDFSDGKILNEEELSESEIELR